MKQKDDHEHLWSYRPRAKAGWCYECAVCHIKSRNDLVQPPQFRKPLVLRSVYYDFTGETPTAKVLPPMIMPAND